MPGLHAFQHALDAHARSKCARCRNTVESWNLRLEAGQQKLLPAVPTSLVTTDLGLQKKPCILAEHLCKPQACKNMQIDAAAAIALECL